MLHLGLRNVQRCNIWTEENFKSFFSFKELNTLIPRASNETPRASHLQKVNIYCQNGFLFWFYVTLILLYSCGYCQEGCHLSIYSWVCCDIDPLGLWDLPTQNAALVCGLVNGHIYRAGVCCSVSELYRCNMIDVLSVSSCWDTLSDPPLSCWS